jgi:transposase
MDIPLSSKDQKTLHHLHRDTKEKKIADRIKAVILLNKGYTQKEIASILMLDEDTISSWIKKFKSSTNIKIWLDNNYIAYQGKLNPDQISQLKTYLTENIILNAKQVISYVKEHFGTSYSLSGMKDLLHSLGFSYKQLTLFPSKADIEKQKQFVLEFEQLNQNLGEDEEIVFIDGVHPQHNTKSSKAWIQKGTEKYIPTNTGRLRLNLNGAYNPNNQDVIIREDPSINAQSTIKLFEQIQNKYAYKKGVYAIADNAKYYRSKLVNKFLETSKIRLIFLPSYSPNLNLIERLWKYLRKEVINTTYYPKFDQFKTAIQDFFENIDSKKSELKQFIGINFHITEIELNPKTISA